MFTEVFIYRNSNHCSDSKSYLISTAHPQLAIKVAAHEIFENPAYYLKHLFKLSVVLEGFHTSLAEKALRFRETHI